jgi:hypothetical protein
MSLVVLFFANPVSRPAESTIFVKHIDGWHAFLDRLSEKWEFVRSDGEGGTDN